MTGTQRTIFLVTALVVGGALACVGALTGTASILVPVGTTAIGGALGAYSQRDRAEPQS